MAPLSWGEASAARSSRDMASRYTQVAGGGFVRLLRRSRHRHRHHPPLPPATRLRLRLRRRSRSSRATRRRGRRWAPAALAGRAGRLRGGASGGWPSRWQRWSANCTQVTFTGIALRIHMCRRAQKMKFRKLRSVTGTKIFRAGEDRGRGKAILRLRISARAGPHSFFVTRGGS